MDETCLKKFRTCFDSMAVYKDLKNSNFFATLGMPSFMRDWLLQRNQDKDGNFSQETIINFIKQHIPRPEDWTRIKDRIVTEYENVKILAKISVDIAITSGEISFSLPDFGLANKHTIIENDVWDCYKNELVSGKETWGMLELGYRPPDDTARPKLPGKIKLISFRNFCPYQINLDYFKEVRAEFTFAEWRDILLGAIDYNPEGYTIAKSKNPQHLPEVATMKLTLLTRLLPFVEKRLNLIELAPKGTGKSYIFGQVSRYGWLSTSDKMTRAKLFYDIGRRENGLIAQNDFLVLDEIQKTEFDDAIGATLQGYLEQGTYTIGNYSGSADCGMVLCGNIPPELMRNEQFIYMFGKLPSIFHDPALIDRFHGFIKGWNIPRMNDDLKISGWALNSEYFTAIMHALRSDSSYRSLVDELIIVPQGADTRDTEAIKRMASASMKLFFPHVQALENISYTDFERYCLRPAMDMRYTIKCQLSQMDSQYRKELPELKVKKYTHDKAL